MSEDKFDRVVIFKPEDHDISSVELEGEKYQLLHWQDWMDLIDSSYMMIKLYLTLYFEKQTAILYWGSNEPIKYLNGKLIIINFVAIQFGFIIINTESLQITLPDKFKYTTDGKRYFVSIYARSKFFAKDKINRNFRNDHRKLQGNPIDYVKKVYTTEILDNEFKLIRSEPNPNQPPGDRTGWVRLGYYRVGSGGGLQSTKPHNFTPDDISRLIVTTHRREFDHPEQSVTKSKMDLGIYFSLAPGASTQGEKEIITLKEISDELNLSKGNTKNLATRILGVIDRFGKLQTDPIDSLIREYILNKFFHKGPLQHPDPFVELENGNFALNMEAVEDTGDAYEFAALGVGTGALGPPASFEEGVKEQAAGFTPQLPENFSNDQVIMVVSCTHAQWGDSSNKIGQLIQSQQLKGCNFRCFPKRRLTGEHLLISWSQMGLENGNQWLYENPLDYIPIGLKLLGAESHENPYQPGGYRKGYARVRVYNIPIMTDENKDELNKRILFCLRDDDNTNFIGVYHRYLQPEWPEGEWWPTWRMEAGSEGHVEEWHIFNSMPLDGTEAIFKVEWEDNLAKVIHEGTNDDQALTTFYPLGLDKACHSSECTKWGWISDADVEVLEFVGEEENE